MRILLIEDNPGDSRLVLEMLKETPDGFTLDSVDRLEAGLEHQRPTKWMWSCLT